MSEIPGFLLPLSGRGGSTALRSTAPMSGGPGRPSQGLFKKAGISFRFFPSEFPCGRGQNAPSPRGPIENPSISKRSFSGSASFPPLSTGTSRPRSTPVFGIRPSHPRRFHETPPRICRPLEAKPAGPAGQESPMKRRIAPEARRKSRWRD
jgi:hypothetical protein